MVSGKILHETIPVPSRPEYGESKIRLHVCNSASLQVGNDALLQLLQLLQLRRLTRVMLSGLWLPVPSQAAVVAKVDFICLVR